MTDAPRYTGHAELTLRVSASDALFVRGLFGLTPGTERAAHLPDRLAVDAHVPLSGTGATLGSTARDAGVPFLIDPQTYFLQDRQVPQAPWCQVPFGHADILTPADLAKRSTQDELVKAVVDYQVNHGATAVIAPYLHIERPDSPWVGIQAALWRRTRAYVEAASINLPVIAVTALGWRCLHHLQGVPQLTELWDSLSALDPAEVALAATRVRVGAHPEDRIVDLLMLVQDMARSYKVTVWEQGLLGEACVIEGAAGYECGVGWHENCDLQSQMSRYRRPSEGHPGARPVYLASLGRSVPKTRLRLARGNRATWARLVCPFADCCAPGGEDLLGDARRHSVVSRVRQLRELDSTNASNWRWNRLAERLGEGLAIATRLNSLAPSSPATPAVDLVSMKALMEVAMGRRARRARIRRTA